jgi:hypothetical protein
MESNTQIHSEKQAQDIMQDDSDSLSHAIGSRRLRKKNYEKINDEIRKKIIFEVTVLGNKLKNICEKLNINVSSAKNVLAIYKKEGRIEKKKYRVKRKKTADDHESFSPGEQTLDKKMNENVSTSNLNLLSGILNNTNKAINPQPDMRLNTLSMGLLSGNYCMCPVIPQAYQLSTPWSMHNMEEYLKSFTQMMINYNKMMSSSI